MSVLLDLYREAFRDVQDIDKTRYLFDAAGCSIFIWISDTGEIDSFQADWKDQIYLHFNKPGALKITRRTDHPLPGAVTENVAPEDRERILLLISTFDNQSFPSLFSIVRTIAHGAAVPDLTLPKSELAGLRATATADFSKRFNQEKSKSSRRRT